MNKNILNYNDKGNWHGYQERYWSDKLCYRGNYKNRKEIGYEENHHLIRTSYYIR